MSDIEVIEHEEALAARAREAMEADGVPTEERVQQSYFGLDETHRYILPDGVSWIEHKTLNEGARKKYQDKVNREVAIDRRTGDARMRLQTTQEQHELVKQAVVDWDLLGPDGQSMPFSPQNLVNKFLVEFPPGIVDKLLIDIRKHNPWLLADMTAEDIQKQIDELYEMLETKKKEEEGNAN